MGEPPASQKMANWTVLKDYVQRPVERSSNGTKMAPERKYRPIRSQTASLISIRSPENRESGDSDTEDLEETDETIPRALKKYVFVTYKD